MVEERHRRVEAPCVASRRDRGSAATLVWRRDILGRRAPVVDGSAVAPAPTEQPVEPRPRRDEWREVGDDEDGDEEASRDADLGDDEEPSRARARSSPTGPDPATAQVQATGRDQDEEPEDDGEGKKRRDRHRPASIRPPSRAADALGCPIPGPTVHRVRRRRVASLWPPSTVAPSCDDPAAPTPMDR